MLAPRLRVAFTRAEYRIGGVVLRIGRRGLGTLPRRTCFLITAHNPGGRRHNAAFNRRAQARLEAALRGRILLRGESGAGPWREAQVLTDAPAPRVLALGRRFRQAALVRLRPGQKPALVSLA